VSLRSRTLQGGAYLALREVIGLLLRLGGILLLTRLIGPTNFGLYAAPLSIATVLASITWWGTGVFLVRREAEPTKEGYDSIFTFLLASSLVVTIAASAGSLLIGERFLDARSVAPLQVMVLTLPINVLWIPAQTKLERAFSYGKLAGIAIGNDIVFYALALPLAWGGAGVWAPVAGYCGTQIWMLASSYLLARYWPRLRWSSRFIKDAVRFGFGYSTSVWILRLRDLVNPLVVGHFLGPTMVGYVALVLRLADNLSFMTKVIARLSIVALARVQGNRESMRRAMEEGIALQVLAVGPMLAGFALVANSVVPLLFGPAWGGALVVFPFIALSTIAAAASNLHSAALYVLQRNADVVKAAIVLVGLLTVGSIVLVPRLGLIGYGCAELLSAGYLIVLDRAIKRLFPFSYRRAVPWLVAFVPPVFASLLAMPWPVILWVPAAALVALSPAARAQIGEYAGLIRQAYRARGGVAPVPK
jgi:O-antigen/teichoic acid export membrane protein